MPLYEYACDSCGHQFEELVFNGDEVECPECHGRQLHRNLSLPAAPRTAAVLPMGCDPTLPPCGPTCRKLQ